MNIGTQKFEQVHYAFTCEGCGSEGSLAVPAEQNFDFSCPEGCAATARTNENQALRQLAVKDDVIRKLTDQLAECRKGAGK